MLPSAGNIRALAHDVAMSIVCHLLHLLPRGTEEQRNRGRKEDNALAGPPFTVAFRTRRVRVIVMVLV